MSVEREPRFAVNHEFETIAQFITDYVTNVSASGVFIASKDPLPPGTRVKLNFTILDEEIEIVEGIGEVVRVSKDPPGMGVAFIELTSHSEDLLRRLLTRGIGG
jgi:uncharacterized protein (TIGR02266 family)